MMILEPILIFAAILGINYFEGCLNTWKGPQKKNKQHAFGEFGYI